MASKATSLSSDLIVRKGDAAPASVQDNVPNKKNEISMRRKSGTIAVTLRLDPERYEKLKLHGIYNRLTNQEILVEALDSYFKGEGK